MTTDLATTPSGALPTASGFLLPAVIADQGDKAAERFFAEDALASVPEQ